MTPLPLAAPLPAAAPVRARIAAWLHDLSVAYVAARRTRLTQAES